jgi:protoheme IX farnesyltransferase
VPVLIGWSSVTNSLSWAPVVLFALIFVWTPPHFWALAIKYKDDDSAADVPMLPSVSDDATVGRQILGYTVLLCAVSLVFVPVAQMGWLYTASAVVLGAVFIFLAVRVLRDASVTNAMRLFGWSITYVTLLFGAMALDQLVLG